MPVRLAVDAPDAFEYHLHDDPSPRDPSRRLLLGVALTAFAMGTGGGAMILGAFTSAPLVGRSLSPPLSTQLTAVDVLGHCGKHVVAIKQTVCSMDHALVSLADDWHNYTLFAQSMLPFWDEKFAYIPMHGILPSVGLHDWFTKEMTSWTEAFPWVEFNQMLFLGSGPNASTTTYAVGDWKGALGPLAPTGKRTTVRITDFYVGAADGRIARNYMMIDLLDLLRQQGIHPLPLSPLPQGRVSPPQGDGIPAPLARYARSTAQADDTRRVVEAMLAAEWVGTSTSLEYWKAEDLVWYGPVPFGLASGGEQFKTHFLKPFHAAFGQSRALVLDAFACEGQYCAARGTFSGVHTGSWLGFAPSGKTLSLEFGMHWRVIDGLIAESWAIFDLPKMLLPLGVDLLTIGAPATPATPATSTSSPTAQAVLPVPAENNDCSNAYTSPPGGANGLGASMTGDDFDCPAFVIASTDATWHPRDWEATNRAVDTYFSEDWQSVRAFGLMLHGREALRSFMADWLGAFPDVFIHVADVFCLGNDDAGYKTTMPYVLTATHTGWSKAYGPPSGRKVKYHGIANCYIKREAGSGQWQYTREWDLPDMWAFITALNLTAAQMPPHPAGDLVPVDQCRPLFEWGSGEMNWFPADAS